MKFFKNRSDLLNYSSQFENQKIRDILPENQLNDINKGNLGQLIEKHIYNIDNNSLREPDISQFGIELKVTPLKKIKNGELRAKERLVISIINYIEEHDFSFYYSHLYKKLSDILLWTYLVEEEKNTLDFKILKVLEFSIPDEDLPTVINDYNIIIEKIKSGNAHTLSESDTVYLAACTKGKNSASQRNQPFSEISAMQRAWSLKPSYMNIFYNKTFLDNGFIKSKSNFIAHSLNVRKGQTLDDRLYEIVAPYYNLTHSELQTVLNVTSSKSLSYNIIAKIFGTTSKKLNNILEFEKGNIKCKTIRLEANGPRRIIEDISFRNFKFIDISNEKNFSDSQFYSLFNETKYLFFIFEYSSVKQEYVFKEFRWWNLSYDGFQLLEQMWNKLKKSIETGVIINKRNNRYSFPNLPKKSDNIYFHVRTKSLGKNKNDSSDILPDGRTINKHCLFLDSKYIEEDFYGNNIIKIKGN